MEKIRNVWQIALVLSATLPETAALHKKEENTITMTQSSPQPHNNGRELIINGQPARRGRYPYFSTLHHDCGGALIAPDTVLTAGHCLPKHKDSVQPRVGTYSFYDKDDDSDQNSTTQFFDIVAMERHPHWKALGEDEFRHDVALLFLNDSVADNIPFIRLNRNASLPFPGEQVTAMGVGWTSNDYKHAEKAMILQQVHLEYQPNDQCVLATNENSVDDDEEIILYQDRIHPDHMCTTGGLNNERDACAYDSGSPIIVEGANPEEDILVGLVSWGEGCADPDFPAVNTRISDALEFIESSVCEHSAYPPPGFNCPGAATSTFAPSTEAPPPTASEEETFSPTDSPTPPANTTIFSPFRPCFIIACLAVATLCWIRQRAASGKQEDKRLLWMPSHKSYLERQESSETEYLYHSSPASSKGSAGYNAIEILNV